MIIIDDYDQLSDEWFQARLGNPGASNFSKIITTKGEPSKQADDYMYQLAGELVSKQAESSFSTPWMERGTQLESEARDLYSLVNGVDVLLQCALVYYDERKDRHCSPDGLVSDHGLEIKCPMAKTHVKYLLNGSKLPTEYFQQVQGSMYICGFDSWDFVSYSPGLPMFQLTVERDEKFCRKLDAVLDEFCGKLADVVAKLKAMQ